MIGLGVMVGVGDAGNVVGVGVGDAGSGLGVALGVVSIYVATSLLVGCEGITSWG